MRIRVSHQTTFRYAPAAKAIIQTLRLTPRNHDSQFVINWRIDVDVDSRLRQGEDAFANLTHVLSVAGPLQQLTLSVEGEVETQDAAGVVRGAVERFPEPLFLRETPLTEADETVQAFAHEAVAGAGADRLSQMHALMESIHGRLAASTAPHGSPVAAAEALEAGVADDAAMAHLFVASARCLGAPARFISGYVWTPDAPSGAQAGHGWAEVHVPGLGWVGFDPLRKLCPTAAYIRVAIGLDALGAAPIRGAFRGGDEQPPDIRVRLDAQEQSQS